MASLCVGLSTLYWYMFGLDTDWWNTHRDITVSLLWLTGGGHSHCRGIASRGYSRWTVAIADRN